MKKNNKELTIEEMTVKDCPILYRMRYRPMTETCMCWGFECGDGWMESIRDASYELETLNATYYPKYRIRIQADQIKEKYGTLHWYYSVVVDHGKFLSFITNMLECLEDYCSSHDFKTKTVVDVEPHDYDDVEIITKEDYDKEMKREFKISNVECIKEKDGTYKRITHLRDYGKRHQEPTKNVLWWKLGNVLRRFCNLLNYSIPKKNNSETRRIVRYMDIKAEEIIRKTEEKCSRTCERCGSQIGTDWSPTCQTRGWITYICDECAKNSDSEYYMNGKLYHKGKRINSKEKSKSKKQS